MRIIQISGKGRVGKTTLAKFIQAEAFNLGYIPMILPFALAIKDSAAAAGITKEGDSTKYRDFCQELGATMRKREPDHWVTKTYNRIQEYMMMEVKNKQEKKKFFEYVLIQDDVRYMNELALGRDLVAYQIFLDSAKRKLEEHDAPWRTHESELLANTVETAFGSPTNNDYDALFDLFLSNGSNLKALETEVKRSLPEWLDVGFLELEELDESEFPPESYT